MKIFALVGASGTGKSYVAEEVAKKTGSGLIIDDGVLISHGQMIAGYSGKLEKHAIKAVRRAIFMNKDHRADVMTALSHYQGNDNLLVLGTSRKMILTICSNLELTEDINWLAIEDFVSSEELALASRLRMYGMHAMPIAASQVQQSKHYWLLKQIQYRLEKLSPQGTTGEERRRLIVNPVFSGGGIYVHPRAIKDLVTCVVSEEQHPFRLRQTKVEFEPSLTVKVNAAIELGTNIQRAAEALLSSLHRSLTANLGLPLIQVHLRVETISVQTTQSHPQHEHRLTLS
ncbi:isopentenyl transferase family protein [Alicyclobacillus sp. SO9]|uniref:isopentenyl transferase family protein n=1 Tax=Alicyclobacillus sp. SO9 TaxID=2665646 RepID=UPI0018E84022|nr:isopentenyl transferase family protein [Alicyclobacillus sp. SO9]QQE80646.1 hypothetical protein GI364_09745 [Alicyclobacillus sp. SO9]